MRTPKNFERFVAWNSFTALGVAAMLAVMLVAPATFAQNAALPVIPAAPAPTPAPVIEAPRVVEASPTTMSDAPSEGFLTVSMLNGKSQLKLFGSFSAIGIFSTDRPFSAGLPLFILPSAQGARTNTFDLHARQTSFGAIFNGPEVFGLTPGATFLAFIQNDNLVSDAYGLLPYNAYGELKNERWRFAAGLMNDVFNPGKPTIISLSSLFGSGNTGSFRAQARLENYQKLNPSLQITTQLAISEPVSTILQSTQRILEDNGWPNVEGRVAVGIGEIEALAGGRKQRRLELGVSGTVGQLRSSRLGLGPADEEVLNRVVDIWGLGLDGQVAVTDRVGFAGEFFIGQALGEYNGGVLQSFNNDLQPIRTAGGWGEMYVYVTDQFHIHTGYGIDSPIRRDVSPAGFARNQTYYTNLVWDASKNVQISFEVDYRKTDYAGLRSADGVVFLTQFLWRF